MNDNNPIKKASNECEMSIEEIIKAIGIGKEQVEELDKNPWAISMDLVSKLEDVTGVDSVRFMPEKKIAGPKIANTYEKETKDLIALIEKQRESCKKLQEKYKELQYEEVSEILERIRGEYENTAKTTLEKMKKPVVCAFGNSDTGKSTLINYFLGEEVAKTGYSPLTSTIIYYEHIADMPEHLKKNSGHNAFVFGKVNNGKSSRNKKQEFVHDDVKNSSKAKKYLISSGELTDIINEYSSREGENYRNKEYKIFEIAVYLDNDMLRELSFIDIPGFGSGDRDDDVGLTRMDSVDILFYLMPANAFMRETDIAFLQKIIKNRNKLEGLYVLATQANLLGSPIESKRRLDSGHEIFVKWLTEKEKKRIDIDYNKKLRECFYPFDIKHKGYCKTLNEVIERDIPALTINKMQEAKERLDIVCKALNKQYKDEKDKITSGHSSEKKNKIAEELFITERKKELRIYRAELKNEIEAYRKKTINGFQDAYDAFMNEKNLIRLMEEKELKNESKEKNKFSVYLSNEIGELLSEEMQSSNKAFSERLNRFLEQYEKSWNQGKAIEKCSVDFSGFDFTRAFASGLAGVGTYGALAVWAAVVAGGSNLGAYILVAKVVSALSAIGISLGGTSAVASAVAAIGGPVTLGVALAALAAVSIFGLFSGNWKQRLARDLIASYKKQHFKENYVKQINQHWDDTIAALDECLNALENELLDYYHKMNSVQERAREDEEFCEIIKDIYFTICSIYWEIQFRINVDKERTGNSIFIECKNRIEEEVNKLKALNTKKFFDADIREMEGTVFLNPDERVLLWKDLESILNGEAGNVIKLTNGIHLLKRDFHYAIYYKELENQIRIRYIDTYPYLKENYDLYKDLIVNTYILVNDQIRYKILDMISTARKEILIIMPWITQSGWEKDGGYPKSVKAALEQALKMNKELKVVIFAGYDLLHPNEDREKKTVKMAKQILREFSAYTDRFKIYTGIGTHEKRITIDNICALSGSYNLLSNIAPYQKTKWAADSMEVLENPVNIERQRREIFERAKLEYHPFE